jgi:hypothetical protein
MKSADLPALVPLVQREASSSRIVAFTRTLPCGELAASHWTRVEFSSLVAREVRMRALAAQAAAEADDKFETMLKDTFEIVLPGPADFCSSQRISAQIRDRTARVTRSTWRSQQTGVRAPSTRSTDRSRRREKSSDCPLALVLYEYNHSSTRSTTRERA